MNSEEYNIKDFKEELKKSQQLNSEWEKVFKRIFGNDCKIKFQDNKIAQLDFGIDTIIQDKRGRKFSIEFKTRENKFYNWNDYILEIKHLYYKDLESAKNFLKEGYLNSKEGWLYCSTADYILFGTLNKEENKIVEVFCFSLNPFKSKSFCSEISKLSESFSKYITPYSNCFQRTLVKKAPKEFLEKNAEFSYYKDFLKKTGGITDFF